MSDKPADHRVQSSLGDDESRREFGRQLAIDSLLESVLGEQEAPASVPSRSTVLGFLGNITHLGSSFTPTFWTVLAVVLGVALIGGVVNVAVYFLGDHFDVPAVVDNAPPPSEKSDNGAHASNEPVARLGRMVGCVWSDGAAPPAVGDGLVAGRKLVLKSGLAEIAFEKGAQAILQGPATLEVRSRGSAVLNQGKCTVTAESPSARGFEINAPGMKYTDLGTEFGVLVAPSGEQQVHVFRGKVQAQQSEEPGAGARERTNNSLPSASGSGAGGNGVFSGPLRQPLILSDHEAIRVAAPDAAGKPADHEYMVPAIERIAADEKQFVRSEQMPQVIGKLDRWKQYRDELCKRPDVIAYYDFQPDEADRTLLRNRAASGRQYDGRLIGGAKWREGRFPGKQALEFVERGSGVRVNIPVGCKQLTLVAWVRKHRGVQLPLAAIMDSDDFRTRAGAVHWQFATDRKSFFMDISKGAKQINVVRPNDLFNRAASLDQWCMYAETFDATKSRGSAYFNGKPVGQEMFGKVQSAKIGPATIGGFVSQPPVENSDTNRTLGGDIDELMIFKSVIDADQIAQFYQNK